MIDKTQEVLDLYEDSEINYDHLLKKYIIVTNGVYMTLLFPKNYLTVIDYYSSFDSGDVVFYPFDINQNHPEIVKIRKRLEFLNKL